MPKKDINIKIQLDPKVWLAFKTTAAPVSRIKAIEQLITSFVAAKHQPFAQVLEGIFEEAITQLEKKKKIKK